jgi:thymidylate kinase
LSSLAYQGASVSHEFIHAANRFARKPDLTLFLYVPASVALERVRSRGAKLERYETAAQLQAIEREYSRLVGTLASVVSIDGTRPVAEVTDLCYAALQQQLG